MPPSAENMFERRAGDGAQYRSVPTTSTAGVTSNSSLINRLPSSPGYQVEAFTMPDEHGRAVDTPEAVYSPPARITSMYSDGALASVPRPIAHFVTVYADLLPAVEEFVFMGGGVGMGNRSAAAEFNILCDPHAAQMVLNAPIKTTMMPINVTHTAIVTEAIHRELLSPGSSLDLTAAADFPKASSNLRHTLSTLISYFANSYKSTFGFNDGPRIGSTGNHLESGRARRSRRLTIKPLSRAFPARWPRHGGALLHRLLALLLAVRDAADADPRLTDPPRTLGRPRSSCRPIEAAMAIDARAGAVFAAVPLPKAAAS
ncbi:hypothetical protein HYPSUDRAFT_1066593 [Hypholoma sublateritium FD-334 SS-4]|uniref:Inosine/uridine-preferring nucleoside hydrolase domain-containing protein n=1 Tax=Hypholoma sublateritium (strain FD-334 SS-4) TaxID=945553 RepID=A0A0D2KMP6_HYPSF|nr:hypothetical protein HYPSUDRAFT_1066593 [Hypholoma sublateritium FD-334 SS-4]